MIIQGVAASNFAQRHLNSMEPSVMRLDVGREITVETVVSMVQSVASHSRGLMIDTPVCGESGNTLVRVQFYIAVFL